MQENTAHGAVPAVPKGWCWHPAAEWGYSVRDYRQLGQLAYPPVCLHLFLCIVRTDIWCRWWALRCAGCDWHSWVGLALSQGFVSSCWSQGCLLLKQSGVQKVCSLSGAPAALVIDLWCAPISHLFNRTQGSTAAEFTIISNVEVLYHLCKDDCINCTVVKTAFG